MRSAPQSATKPNSAIFVDSSAWIAFFSSSDGRHVEADAGFRRLYHEKRRMITTPLVFAETHRVLLYRAGIRPARLALDRMAGAERLRVVFPVEQSGLAARAWLDRLADQLVSYTDAMSFAVMEALHCTAVFTFDRDFTAAGFSIWNASAT